MSDAAPEREGSVVLIPLRVVVEALGARISLGERGLVEVYFAAVPSPAQHQLATRARPREVTNNIPSLGLRLGLLFSFLAAEGLG